MDAKFEKLPKWAQFEIQKLRADISTMEAQVAVVLGTTKTRVQVNPFASMIGREHECYLPENETVRFHFGERYIDVRVEGEFLSVLADDQIEIQPRAANVVWARPIAD